ncbi:MAG: ATP-binding protein [Pseudomonadota bacterium]
MRLVAKLILLLTLAAAPAATFAQSPPDPAYARFEAAVADAKSAMMGDPEQALGKADLAIARARDLGSSPKAQVALATAEWLKGEAHIGANQLDKATPVVNEALALAERVAPNTKLHGDLIRSQGAIAAMSGRVQEALADFQRAYGIFQNAREVRSQAITLQDIGQIYWDAGDYPRVLQYYSQAGELYTADPAFSVSAYNNRAEVLRKLGRFDEAEREYNQALAAARTLNSPLLEVRILSNLAATQVEHGKLGPAQATVDRALQLSQAGEAAGWKPFVLGAAAKVAAARGDLPRAAALLQQTFAGADLKTTPLQFREFHEIAASVFERLGQKDLALQHLKAFQRLDSEARNLTASASSQLMSARFDFANQNLRISALKQGQLERDIRIERQQSQFRMIVLIGLLVVGAIVFAVLLISALRIRRSRDYVRAANEVLTEVNGKLEKALKAKTEFLATTSHEIRTPLNGILGMTQILLANRRVEKEIREQIQVVHGAGETMRALVDDILDVAKMETGEIAVASEETRLKDILADAATLWRGHATGKDLTLDVHIDDAPALIRSDGARIRQIVFNLLSNAVKFTPQGTVELKAFVEGPADAETLVLQVVDTGIGIPEAHLELIFEAFHQVDGGTTRQFGGTGLGLAICRNLSGALGGTITVESVVGEGSTFTVRLPLERMGEEAAEAPATGRPTSLGTARLLLVEANPMTQGVMRALLDPAVGRLECVADGDEAIVAIDEGRADHLLIEAKSATAEGLGPLDVLRALVECARHAGIPVTILLAPSEELPVEDIARLGATQLVLKPVSGTQLIATMAEAHAAPAAEPGEETKAA